MRSKNQKFDFVSGFFKRKLKGNLNHVKVDLEPFKNLFFTKKWPSRGPAKIKISIFHVFLNAAISGLFFAVLRPIRHLRNDLKTTTKKIERKLEANQKVILFFGFF